MLLAGAAGGEGIVAVVKAHALGVRLREVRNLKFPLVFSLGGRRFSNFFSPSVSAFDYRSLSNVISGVTSGRYLAY